MPAVAPQMLRSPKGMSVELHFLTGESRAAQPQAVIGRVEYVVERDLESILDLARSRA